MVPHQEATMTREPVRNLTESEYRPLDPNEWSARVLSVLAARLPPMDWSGSSEKPNSHKKSEKEFDNRGA